MKKKTKSKKISKKKKSKKKVKRTTAKRKKSKVVEYVQQPNYVIIQEKPRKLRYGLAEGAGAGFGIAAGNEFGDWIFG